MKKLSIILVSLFIKIALLAQWTTSGANIYNSNSGNVGIGTSQPGGKLQVSDGGGEIVRYGSLQVVRAASPVDNQFYTSFIRAGNSIAGMGYVNNSNVFGFWHATSNSGVPVIAFTSGQNVGIGTSNPGTFKLAVEGKIGAREIQVTNTNPWPDYVFDKNYKLMPLSEIEEFVKQHSHLPGVPSKLEVKDGVELGRMNAILLEKVEELTLYMIELNKKVEKLEAEKAKSKKDCFKK